MEFASLLERNQASVGIRLFCLLQLATILLSILNLPHSTEACCGGGCGCSCCYGCYQPQQQTVQQQPVYIPYPVPVNNNNNNGANARVYRNYVNGGNSGVSNSRSMLNNNNNNNNAETSNAQTNALLASLVTQLQRQNSLAASNVNNAGNSNSGSSSGNSVTGSSGGTSYSNNNALKALQEAAQQQAAADAKAKANSNNPLFALLAQLQQQMAVTTTTEATTTTTTTTTEAPKPSFDFSSALQSFFSNFNFAPPATTTTTTTTTTTPAPPPIQLSQAQVDSLRSILAALDGGANGGSPQRAHIASKGFSRLLAQDAAGGNASFDSAPFDDGGIPFDDDEEIDPNDLIEEDFEHPPDVAGVHPLPSQLLLMLHMAEKLDQLTGAVAPEMAHARPIASRLVSMLDPNGTANSNDSIPSEQSDVSAPPPRPLINLNVPIPPTERDPNIIRDNIFAWENGALTLSDLGKLELVFEESEVGAFEKLNPAPEDSKEGEELDDQQLQGVLMDFYYKLDTYDARDTPEHADLGDEAYELVKKEKSSESSSTENVSNEK